MDWIATILIALVTQQAEHPWEIRLRAIEREQARTGAVAEQLISELKEINKNRTDRIEQLELWKREQDRLFADGDDPAAKAESAKQTADAVAAKVEEAVGKDNPWLVAFGGASGVSALLIGVIGYFTRGALKRLRAELEANESLPSTKTPTLPVGGIAPLNPTGLAGIKSGGD